MSNAAYKAPIPEIRIDVLEPGQAPRAGCKGFELGRDAKFSTAALESYAFTPWEPMLYDAMVLAAAIEYADKILKRPAHGWARRIALQIPVHDPESWNAPEVSEALHESISFVTGDFWAITFVPRQGNAPSSAENYLSLPVQTEAIIAFSDGMDSRAVAGIVGNKLNDKLVRVRVGSKVIDRPMGTGVREPFTSVPYSIKFDRSTSDRKTRETSARSRGFKFALITALAAYLTGASEIILPESGQGAIGPALIVVGHGYPDYRNHPLFTRRMERFIEALLGKSIRYSFPRIWSTKGETLSEYVSTRPNGKWAETKSCWRDSQWSSVSGKLRQCGVCAACMLRRLSVHAANLNESAGTYVCADLSAPTLREGVDKDFKRMSPAFEHYAIAGVLHLDHLADMAADDAQPQLRRHARLLGPALGLTESEAEERLTSLLQRHAAEWRNFLSSIGENSFVRQWTRF